MLHIFLDCKYVHLKMKHACTNTAKEISNHLYNDININFDTASGLSIPGPCRTDCGEPE